MSTVLEAGRRLEAAVERLEAILRSAPRAPRVAADGNGEDRELALLEAECRNLRQALDAAEQRNRILADAAGEVTHRLDRTIDDLSDIVEG
jgi:hypothetical protein